HWAVGPAAGKHEMIQQPVGVGLMDETAEQASIQAVSFALNRAALGPLHAAGEAELAMIANQMQRIEIHAPRFIGGGFVWREGDLRGFFETQDDAVAVAQFKRREGE